MAPTPTVDAADSDGRKAGEAAAAAEGRPSDDQNSDDVGLISERAEVFRAKLLRQFRLLDAFDEGGAMDVSSTEAPHLQTMDLIDDGLMKTTLVTEPNGLVQLQVYSNRFAKSGSVDDRRINRVHNKNTRNPPIDLWACWVVQSTWFQNFILAVLVINTVILGLQADLGGPGTPVFILTIFEVIDILALLIFVTEIVLKWLDDFVTFWSNNWNVFDFVITAFCLVIEVIRFISIATESAESPSDLAFTAQSLRNFRIMRSLKLISRFKDAREITVCVTNSIKSIVFIGILMFIYAFIYAVIGVTFFDYTKFNPNELAFPNAFSGLGAAFKTLFQVFTNDHWIPIMKDVTIVTGDVYFAPLYVASWLTISCFIFGSILIGIIISSFQKAQEEMRAEEEKMKRRAMRDDRATAFASALDEEAKTRLSVPAAAAGKGEQPDAGGGRSESFDRLDRTPDANAEAWTAMVERNMVDLALEESNFCWPRDTLLRYYVLMEALQENLEERRQLLDLANHSILQMFDV